MVGKGKKRANKKHLTSFQIFTLLFLYYQESRESEKRSIRRSLTIGRNFYPGSPYPKFHISLRELAILIPTSTILAEIMNINQMYNELKILEVNDLLVPQWDRDFDKDNYVFSLTTSGIIWVKHYLGLLPHLTEMEDYTENVENSESTNEVKQWFKGLKDKIKGKAQDEIAEIIVTGVKTHGLSLITSIINLAN